MHVRACACVRVKKKKTDPKTVSLRAKIMAIVQSKVEQCSFYFGYAISNKNKKKRM